MKGRVKGITDYFELRCMWLFVYYHVNTLIQAQNTLIVDGKSRENI